MQCAAFMNDEGNLSVMVPVSGGIADRVFFAREIAKLPSAKPVSDFVIIDSSAVPTDRTFRNAWKLNGTVVDHDMTKAREIQRERVRRRGGSPDHPSIDAATTIAQLKVAGLPEVVARLRSIT